MRIASVGGHAGGRPLFLCEHHLRSTPKYNRLDEAAWIYADLTMVR
ncbi:MAG: hypothetical protein WCB19_07400 [Thermoplasmata archaeon]